MQEKDEGVMNTHCAGTKDWLDIGQTRARSESASVARIDPRCVMGQSSTLMPMLVLMLPRYPWCCVVDIDGVMEDGVVALGVIVGTKRREWASTHFFLPPPPPR